jgi:hypothetical protein
MIYEPQWIKVSDQLPEAYSQVLVTNSKHSFHIWIAYYEYDRSVFMWSPERDIKSVPLEVTHWMPVPENPWFKENRSVNYEKFTAPFKLDIEYPSE